MKLPLPAPSPPILLADKSTIVSSSVTSSLIVPEPVPVLAVTVLVMPLSAETEVTEAPETPVVVREKSPVPTPVTDSLKVTVKSTELAAVGEGLARTIEETVGGVASAALTTIASERAEIMPDEVKQIFMLSANEYC